MRGEDALDPFDRLVPSRLPLGNPTVPHQGRFIVLLHPTAVVAHDTGIETSGVGGRTGGTLSRQEGNILDGMIRLMAAVSVLIVKGIEVRVLRESGRGGVGEVRVVGPLDGIVGTGVGVGLGDGVETRGGEVRVPTGGGRGHGVGPSDGGRGSDSTVAVTLLVIGVIDRSTIGAIGVLGGLNGMGRVLGHGDRRVLVMSGGVRVRVGILLVVPVRTLGVVVGHGDLRLDGLQLLSCTGRWLLQ